LGTKSEKESAVSYENRYQLRRSIFIFFAFRFFLVVLLTIYREFEEDKMVLIYIIKRINLHNNEK